MADSGATLSVDVVAPDRNVYRGPATIVIARTLEGELGILKGHVPVLGVLESGAVTMSGDADEMLHDPRVKAAYLGE